jgi:diamine N-acetyltransferase
MKIQKVLSDSTIRIRPLSVDDLPLTLAWRNHDDSRKWFKNDAVLSWEIHRNWFDAYVLKDTDIVFAVEGIANAELLGQVACYNIDRNLNIAEVGRFLINPQMRGRGAMNKAIQLLFQFCKESLEMKAVYLEVLVSNHRAISLYRKLGFVETSDMSSEDMLKMHRLL